MKNNSVEISVSPEQVENLQAIEYLLKEKLGTEKFDWIITRRSLDARGKNPVYRLRCQIVEGDRPPHQNPIEYPDVHNAREVIVVGSGPAGYFAALKLIERGLKPIVLDRGKDVKLRRKDIGQLHSKHIVDPDSNYCFGEGGAGTFSDGKLYTRSTKRGDLDKILSVFVRHGASEDILIDARPHIGTNKLPKIITAMRGTIESCGGEVLFNHRVTDFLIEDNQIQGVEIQDGTRIKSNNVILATGHSAEDIFELLAKRKILIEAKPFALGVRVEHPQRLIDQMQYNCEADRGKYLPAASYGFVHEARERGVYSFCMCPGGQMVPSATSPGEIVMNGMSASTRSSRYANSGVVVSVEQKDIAGFKSAEALAFLRFRKQVEQKMCEAAGGDQTAPAQRLADFVASKRSSDLNKSSYLPGLAELPLHELLPKFIRTRLQEAFRNFDKKMHGYLTNEAQIAAPESRTSSPVRIPRHAVTLQHPQIQGLYPCGEGAGFAGGIVSAAMDGEKTAAKIAESVSQS